MKRSGPWNGIEELSSDSDSGSDDGVQMSCSKKRNKDDNPASTKDNSSESTYTCRDSSTTCILSYINFSMVLMHERIV